MDTSDYILLSELNDYIFCPRSVYWHHIYSTLSTHMYQESDQVLGTLSHRCIDTKKYSTRKNILQALPIISHEYGIQGKIDTFDTKTWILTERKRSIKKVYKWYEWQLYGQYFCLSEMWYLVTSLRLYSMSDNRVYKIALPNNKEIIAFKKMIESFRNYSMKSDAKISPKKCKRCIYNTLCDIHSSK